VASDDYGGLPRLQCECFDRLCPLSRSQLGQSVPATLPAPSLWFDDEIRLHREYAAESTGPRSPASGHADRLGTQTIGGPVQGVIGIQNEGAVRSSLVSSAVGAPAREPCVAVVGMHRSGTSAAAGLLVSLGLAGPTVDDLVPENSSNERGHWESLAVILCNKKLLRARDVYGYAPPQPQSTWSDVANYQVLRSDAAEWYTASFSGTPIVMKDPRLCLTLPFWRDALPAPMVAILVLRDPLQVARSLQKRDNLPMSLGLALWDRYLRSASFGLEGLPVQVVDYDRLLADPRRGTSEAVEFLASVGIDVAPAAFEAGVQSLDQNLRHHLGEEDRYTESAGVQREIHQQLLGMAGVHEAWKPPTLPSPPLWVDDVIALRLRYDHKRREVRLLRKSPIVRVSAKLRKVRPVSIERSESR
jgi:hypothetical protein